MKAILEFDISPGSDDAYAWNVHQNAEKMAYAISELRDHLRKIRKYHEFPNDEMHAFFDKLDDEIIDIFSDVLLD